MEDNRGVLGEILNSETTKVIINRIEKAVERGIRKGVEKGVEKGIVKGLEKSLDKAFDSKAIEERLKIVTNLLMMGMDEVFINSCTGLSIEEIIKIRSRMT